MNQRRKGGEEPAVLTLLRTNQLKFIVMARQRRFLRFIENLPSISEEPNRPLLLEIPKKWFLNAAKRREVSNCDCNTHNPTKAVACQVSGEIAATRNAFFFLTDDSEAPLKYKVKTSKLRGMDEARVLFPEFFPPSKRQYSCVDSKATMERLFSKQNDFSENCDEHENYEYWKRYHLSF